MSRTLAALLALSLGCVALAAGQARAQELGPAFTSLSAEMKAGADGMKAAAFKRDEGRRAGFRDVENAFKGMGEMLHPAEMVSRDGNWNLELAANESDGVSYSPSGFTFKEGKKPVRSRLIFTQEILRSDNPYVDKAAVFRVQERAIRVAPLMSGDPPAAVIDLKNPGKFSTVYEPAWGVRAVKTYECRSNDEDHILCRVDVTGQAVVSLPPLRFYLGFARDKS